MGSTEKKPFSSGGRVNCFTCTHFFITHEPSLPYGCKMMGFKSGILPSLTVYKNSGAACQAFEGKNLSKNL